MSITRRVAFALLASMTVTAIAGAILSAHAKPPLNLAIRRQQSRNEHTRFETVIDALDITGGMTILDIGSGPGYASFLFAGKLRGSGKVFATDIRADFVDHIAAEAKNRGLTNLFPVLVTAEGVDDFYGKHRYDMVFVSNVYHALENRIGYFTRLRGLLNPGARLVLILYNQAPLFSVEDLSDIDSIVDSLSEDPEDNPFYKQLSGNARRLLAENSSEEELKSAIVADFNKMLADPKFYEGFYGNSYFRKDLFNTHERDFANWLLMTLKEDGVLEKPVDQIDPKAMRTVMKLNRLFFINRFGDYLALDGMGAYVPAGDANRQTSKYVMLRELDAAGYNFSREITSSPYFDALIMVPKVP